MNPRLWLQTHSLKLLAIRDTPEAIAGGMAIGIFLGFTPLFGLKTLLAIFFAWVTRSNIIAAVVATTLHDLLLPFMPVIFVWEYKVGYWLLNYEWPQRMTRLHLRWNEWLNWTTFLTVGKPLLVGSIFCGLPLTMVLFFVVRGIVARHQHKKHPAVHPGEPHVAKD